MALTATVALAVVVVPVVGALPADDPVAAPGDEATPEATEDHPATDEPATEEPTVEPTEEPATEVPTTAPPTPEPTPEPTTATPEPTETTATPTPTPTTTAPAWTTPPTVTTTTIPAGLIVVALVVLVLATSVLAVLHRRLRGREAAGPAGVGAAAGATDVRTDADDAPTVLLPGPMAATSATTVVLPAVTTGPATALPTASGAFSGGGDGEGEVVRFLVVLGEAMIDTTAPVSQVQDSLERVAAVNGIPDVEVVALPTALLVSDPSSARRGTAAVSTGSRTLRLDQIQGALEVVRAAEAGEVGPADGTAALAAALNAPPTYPAWQRTLGYVMSAAGLSLVLGGTMTDLLVAAVLGLGVAAFQTLTERWGPAYQAIVVLLSSFAVATVVFALSRTGLHVTLLAPLVSPLVTFLPGAVLTTAAIDLATRQMIAGSARLAAGVMSLVLLAMGIVGAANLVGVAASQITGSDPALGWVGPWIGVLVYGVGVTWKHCARRTAVPWILLVLVVAYAGQLVGGALLGSQLSAFVGALVMTPVALAVAERPTGPPTLVSFLPGFWLLVPGALSLVGVTSFLGDSLDEGLAAVVTAGTTMVTISLGVLAGLGLGAWLLAHQPRWVGAVRE